MGVWYGVEGGLYKGIKWELWSYLWACLGVFVGVVWYYMGLFLYKSRESMGKWEFFVGFSCFFVWEWVEFWKIWEGVEGVKGFNLWGYGNIYINFLSWKE